MVSLDVTVIDIAAHTAYLEPLTGTGFLVLPLEEHNTADWEYALNELDQLGWFLLDDERGAVEIAGHCTDGRLALCIYGEDSIIDEPNLDQLRAALTALHLATGVPPS